ncbi:hypothetical protein CKO35_01065 [Ectothiorhodospira shaposhnikovii]|uniref:hypothetical protein n=1 Tax=Ectothiorhodospira shaposhnikovii TaxID=1054 RepID=UPI0019069153|nr:hypothetical protein [Ectothiorhodospira shaposhnikovii]MBK1671906.1 hypothetical protein [Ectothiorhodospira shaposhnikovii]
MLKRIAVIVSVLFLLAGQALAMNITSSDMERFINTFEQLKPHVEDHEFDDDDDDDDDLNFLEIDTLKDQFMEALADNREAERIIRDNGYGSVAAFAEKSAYILRAYIAHTGMTGLDEFQTALQDMPAEEREMLMAMPFFQTIQDTRARFAAVPAAQVRAILPYMDQLNALFDMEEDDMD